MLFPQRSPKATSANWYIIHSQLKINTKDLKKTNKQKKTYVIALKLKRKEKCCSESTEEEILQTGLKGEH